MKKLLTLSCLMLALSGSAYAGDADPLFINMTSDDNHRANMAITFGTKQHARGHALTIFLNDKGVLVGSKAHAKKFADRQKDLIDAMSKGATVSRPAARHQGRQPRSHRRRAVQGQRQDADLVSHQPAIAAR